MESSQLATWAQRTIASGTSVHAAALPPVGVLVIADCERNSICDEAFRDSFAAMFVRQLRATVTFQIFGEWRDDPGVAPDGTEVVFVILNEGSSRRDELLDAAQAFTLPLCAIGRCIASVPDDRFRMFDHVIVSSESDEARVSSLLGAQNVTFMPDLVLGWTRRPRNTNHFSFPMRTRKLCLCLTPDAAMFEGDPALQAAMNAALRTVTQALRCRLSVIVLSTGRAATAAQDAAVANVVKGIAQMDATVYSISQFTSFAGVRTALRDAMAVVSTCFSSFVFACQESVPAFVIAKDTDDQLLESVSAMKLANACLRVLRVGDDAAGDPDFADGLAQQMLCALKTNGSSALADSGIQVNAGGYTMDPVATQCAAAMHRLLDSVVVCRRTVSTLALLRPSAARPFSRAWDAARAKDPTLTLPSPSTTVAAPQWLIPLHDQAVHALIKLTGSAESVVRAWYDEGDTNTFAQKCGPNDVVATLLYVFTGSLDAPETFQLANALPLGSTNPTNQTPRTALTRIVLTRLAAQSLATQPQARSPDVERESAGDSAAERAVLRAALPQMMRLPLASRRLLDLDALGLDATLSFQSSGWRLAMMGLRYFTAAVQHRTPAARATLCVDPYVDRTFGWDAPALRAASVIPHPARQPWVGFVHHPFDVPGPDAALGSRNLLRSPDFLASLRSCVGLFAPSADLADSLRRALSGKFGSVHALFQPARDDVPAAARFSMDRFLANGDRKLLQVGAWLRDLYAIYDLHLLAPLSSGTPPLVRKVLLRTAREPASYLPPRDASDLFVRLSGVAREAWAAEVAAATDNSGSSAAADPMCRPLPSDGDGDVPPNRYVEDMLRSAQVACNTVTVQSVSDDASYRALLRDNVVFLRLRAATGVDVVQDCVAHATPLIVNRLPALEEVLGADYPGFYASLPDAAAAATDVDLLRRCHEHLAGLDASRFSLSRFLSDFFARVG